MVGQILDYIFLCKLDSIAALYDKLAVATSDSGTVRKYIYMEINHKTEIITNWKIRTKLTPEFRSKLTPCFSFNSRQESRNSRAEPSRFAA